MTAKPSKPARRQAVEYADRDRAILRFVWRYEAAVAAMVSERFLEGKQAGHVLRRFEARGWVALESAAIPGGISYVTITAAGGREIGVAVKPKPMSAVRLDAALAVSGFCVLEEGCGGRRSRLLPAEVNELKGGFPANAPHVLTTDFGEPAVLRVLMASSGKPRAVLDKAALAFDKALSSDKGHAWIESLDYGCALLAHTPERLQQLKAAASNDARFEGRRLVIGLGPTSETLAALLRQRRKR